MTKCVFCGREEHDFKGVHLIKNDGVIDFYCSSKCRKNSLKLKRDKRKMKWTLVYKDGLKTEAARKIIVAKETKDRAEKKIVDDKKASEKSKESKARSEIKKTSKKVN